MDAWQTRGSKDERHRAGSASSLRELLVLKTLILKSELWLSAGSVLPGQGAELCQSVTPQPLGVGGGRLQMAFLLYQKGALSTMGSLCVFHERPQGHLPEPSLSAGDSKGLPRGAMWFPALSSQRHRFYNKKVVTSVPWNESHC